MLEKIGLITVLIGIGMGETENLLIPVLVIAAGMILVRIGGRRNVRRG